MPNLYVTPSELKAAMPDGIRAATTKYDALLTRLIDSISRLIDQRTGRKFYPMYGIRYFDGSGTEKQRIDDLVSATAVAYSEDDGETYTSLDAADWFGAVMDDPNGTESYRTLILTAYSTKITSWPTGQRSVKVTGWWAYVENRDEAWESSGTTLASNYTAGASTIAVTSAAVEDPWKIGSAFQVGKLLKVDDEVFECLGVNTVGTDTLTVLGARNGTSAAAHSSGDTLSVWRVPEGIKQPCIIQAVRQLERGLQGFGDARANAELGQMQWVRKLDPDVEGYLDQFVKRWYR